MSETRTSLSQDAPLQIPDHDLIRCVGKGSYGEVWLAKSVIGTFRAVKIISRKTFRDDRPFDREFAGIQKFEAVSRTHPGLVSILHVGRNVAAGYFYYVMEVADDVSAGPAFQPDNYVPKTLSAELSRRGRLPPQEWLQIGLRLSEALAHLHQHGLIHRDIKPSNIIFVDGHPKFADIGLVTDVGEKASCVGTEGYMPPEGPGSPTADIYSFGKVLYEMSMGKSHEYFPELPTNLREFADSEQLMRLNEIVLKACAPNAQKRFQSAREVFEALAELAGRKIPVSGGGEVSNSSRSPLSVIILNVANPEPGPRVASLLEQKLAAMGHRVFVDRSRAIDVDWAREIERRIGNCDAAIALLSAASMSNEMLAYEIELARQSLQQRQGKPCLLPVRIQFDGKLPRPMAIAFEPRQTFSWAGEQDDERLLEEIANALETGSSVAAPS